MTMWKNGTEAGEDLSGALWWRGNLVDSSHCGRTQKIEDVKDLLTAYYVPCPAGHHPQGDAWITEMN